MDHPFFLPPAAGYPAVAVVAYLLGSFPTGYLLGRSRGIDIREHGSGNIGATNVLRVLGKWPGICVFVCDALKGWLAVQLGLTAGAFLGPDSSQWIAGHWWTFHGTPFAFFLVSSSSPTGIVAALACILGHNFPVWLRFRGGKGVATTIGVLLGLMPLAMLGVGAVWFAVFRLFRYVSLASMLAAAALPLCVWGLNTRMPHRGGLLADAMFWFAVVAALLIVWRHHSNIRRLLDGAEPRFARKPAPPAAS